MLNPELELSPNPMEPRKEPEPEPNQAAAAVPRVSGEKDKKPADKHKPPEVVAPMSEEEIQKNNDLFDTFKRRANIATNISLGIFLGYVFWKANKTFNNGDNQQEVHDTGNMENEALEQLKEILQPIQSHVEGAISGITTEVNNREIIINYIIGMISFTLLLSLNLSFGLCCSKNTCCKCCCYYEFFSVGYNRIKVTVISSAVIWVMFLISRGGTLMTQKEFHAYFKGDESEIDMAQLRQLNDVLDVPLLNTMINFEDEKCLWNPVMWLSICLPFIFYYLFGWETPEWALRDEEEKDRCCCCRGRTEQRQHEAVVVVVQAADQAEKKDGDDDDEYFATLVKTLAMALDNKDDEGTIKAFTFIKSLWDQNQKLPAPLKSSNREQFWEKHIATVRERLLDNAAEKANDEATEEEVEI